MKLGKIETAILNQECYKNFVTAWEGYEYVSVIGPVACRIARQMKDKGLIKDYVSHSEYGRIGNNLDGSWKYGMTFQGRVYLYD